MSSSFPPLLVRGPNDFEQRRPSSPEELFRLTPSEPLQIGRYSVIARLGVGGMGKVYLAAQNGPFDAVKLVVIKQVREELAGDREFLAMFMEEARIALRLNHPNVVHTYEVAEGPGQPYLTMEFLDGPSLAQLVRRIGRQQMPLEEHLWILTQVLAGLAYAHDLRDFDGEELGIVHRDVTPSNVVVTHGGEVKLLDFGIAKAAGSITATRQGVLKGKVAYTSPEQIQGYAASSRSDTYAVGVMLWEAMARCRRTLGDTPAALLQARLHGLEPAIDVIWPDAPPALVAITKQALSADPDHRYPTALAFQRDLEAYLDDLERPVNAKSVAALVAQAFEGERSALQRMIEERLLGSRPRPRAPRDEAPTFAPPPLPEQRRTPPPLPPAPSSGVDALAPERSFRTWLLPAGVAVLAAVVGAALVPRAEAPAPRTAANSAAPKITPPGAAAEAPAASASSVAEPAAPKPVAAAKVAVRIMVTPAWATVRLDGQRLPNVPYKAVLPSDDRQHSLVVRAAGYEPIEQSLFLTSDVDLHLSLTFRGSRRAPASAGASRARVAPVEPTTAAVAVAPPPAPSTPPARPAVSAQAAPSRTLASTAAEPGVDLRTRKTAPPAHRLDEGDPYAH